MMFPWLAFGHMIPDLELAKLIARKGHHISYVSTPWNIDRLPELPPDLSPLITFIKLPLPRHANLPQGAKSTTDGLQQPFAQLLRSSSPDWVFFDFAPYWVPSIAGELGIPTAFFLIFNASFLAFLGPVPVLMGTEGYGTKPEDFTVPPSWIPFKSTLRYLPFEIARVFNDGMAGDDENVADTYRIGAAVKGCDMVLLKSCSEFEAEWFKLLEELHRKPVIPTGLLPATADDGSDGGDGWRKIKEWLDKQGKGSVVYIAFGSEAELSQDELTEIAMGLELSGLPFFWVLRKPSRLGNDVKQIELPDGFEERTKGRGLVWTSWALQPKILSHDLVGGFLTHGGWGSLVEGIQYERALILCATKA
ncbi:Soyasaponin III rhamnosyltransferase [Bertholletia excelsa]